MRAASLRWQHGWTGNRYTSTRGTGKWNGSGTLLRKAATQTHAGTVAGTGRKLHPLCSPNEAGSLPGKGPTKYMLLP